MSHSFKRVPGFSGFLAPNAKPLFLRLMNRRLRRLDPFDEGEGLADGSLYRRFIDRWSYREFPIRFFSRRELQESWLGGRAYRAKRK
jgi:hypothetical protein